MSSSLGGGVVSCISRPMPYIARLCKNPRVPTIPNNGTNSLFVFTIFLLLNSFLNLLHAINPLTMLINLPTPFFYSTTTLSPNLTLTRLQARLTPHLKNIIFLPQSRNIVINKFIMISNICLVVDVVYFYCWSCRIWEFENNL